MNKGLGKLKNKIALLLLFLISCGFSTPIFAQTNTYTGASGGNWNTTTNWSLNLVPIAAHDVVIPDNKNLTINTAVVCKTFTIKTGANNNTITISGTNSLTVTNAITIETPTANNKTKVIAVTTGVLTCASVVMATTAGDTRDCRITTTSGTVNVSGNITMNGVALRNQLRIDGTAAAGGTLNIGGSLTGGDFLSASNNSTINFNGIIPQTIPINVDYVYNKLVINNVAGATLQAAVTTANVKDNITVQSGTLNNGGFAIAGNGTKTFAIINGASLLLSGTTSAFPSGFGTNTLGATSTVEYKGIGAQTIFDVALPGYGNLTISNNSIKTAAAGLDIQGHVTVNNSTTLAFITFAHNIKGDLLNGGTVTVTTGTINVGGNWTNNGTFTPGVSGTVNFNSTTTGKTISGTISGTTGKFNNLTFNGVGGGWTIASNLDVANTLTVTNGTISMSGVLSVAGNTAVTVGAGGNLILENSASLIQSGYTGVNSGNITVKRNSTPIINDDYTYWSSPTNGTQTLLNFSPNTQADKFFSYNNAWIYESTSNSFTSGIGYAIRSPEGTSVNTPAIAPFQFTGKPNNGTIAVAVTIGERLVGNPYPSTLDADAFIDANVVGIGTINQTISGTLYFWTHNHTLVGNDYQSSDYATYTKLGGTGVGTGTGNTTTPTKNIASGQGFFVEITPASGNVTFNNTMRVGANNTNLYKKASKKATVESHRIWLNLTNASSNFSQALIGYADGATNDYDPGFDGKSFDNGTFDLYSVQGIEALTIQARGLPFVDTDTVLLGYSVNAVGTTTISFDHADGIFLSNQSIYLEDVLLNVIHDIKSEPYQFHSEAGTFNNRFVLRYTDKTLGTNENEALGNQVLVWVKNKQIKINSQVESIEQVAVYDLLGKQIYSKKNVNSNELFISNLTSSHQIVIVKTNLLNGKIVTNKIMY